MTPRERAAAIAGFLDAAAPGWAGTVDPLAEAAGDVAAILARALEPHARRVGLDVATYARAHGWITGEPAGPFVVAWRAELARRAPVDGDRVQCAFCPATIRRTPPPWPGPAPVRCPSCELLSQYQQGGMP